MCIRDREKKAVVQEQLLAMQAKDAHSVHSLSQAAAREASLEHNVSSLSRQLERQVVETEHEITARLALKEELSQLKARLEAKLHAEREQSSAAVLKLESALAGSVEQRREECEALKNEVHVKEMKVSALQSELEVLYKASASMQESKFSSTVKQMIAQQRSQRACSLSKIVEMHNSRTPNTPRVGLDSSVEDMYRDLLTENTGLKSQITKLTHELKSAERAVPAALPSVLNPSYVEPLSAHKFQELLESRRRMVSELEPIPKGKSQSPLQEACSRSEIERYRQDLLERSRVDLSQGQREAEGRRGNKTQPRPEDRFYRK
eukprot:TRINITY_DN53664_c0_g1_i1.p1 TRINITY_DN53664_c0_g1~~TRINITY_DN53664_c0_g1_i1.p1  ORF type:complete len:320 (+),score=125.42 TRINITY_DN53664_c0_g1_i1:41-1000(+)